MSTPSQNPLPEPAADCRGNILVVDDTPDNLHLLSRMLNLKGYEVRAVTSGSMALTVVQVAPPELILLDIRMPQMDGYEVCRTLKASEQTRDIPVIFLSAMAEVEDKTGAFEVGGVDFITKPFRLAEVIARVETHLTLRRLQQQLVDQNEQLQATQQAMEQALLTQQTESQRLLLNLMPAAIAQQYNPSSSPAAGWVTPLEAVTLLSVELSRLGAIAEQSTPAAAAVLFSQILGWVEELATTAGVEILQSSGNRFLLVAGVPKPVVPASVAIAEIAKMAIALQQQFQALESKLGSSLGWQMGISHGPAMAGLVSGQTRLFYTLWGITVDTAQLLSAPVSEIPHQASGMGDRTVYPIRVSQTVSQELRLRYSLEKSDVLTLPNGEVQATYWLAQSTESLAT